MSNVLKSFENCYASVNFRRRRADRGELATRISHLGRQAGLLLKLKPRKKRQTIRRLHSVTAKAIKDKVAGLLMSQLASAGSSQSSLFLQPLACSHISHVKTKPFWMLISYMQKMSIWQNANQNFIWLKIIVKKWCSCAGWHLASRAGRAGSGGPPAPPAPPALAGQAQP